MIVSTCILHYQLFLQCLEETRVNFAEISSPIMLSFISSVHDLVSDITSCLNDKVGKEPGNFPPNLQSEWTEFFSESVFAVLLPTYLQMASKNRFFKLKKSKLPKSSSLTNNNLLVSYIFINAFLKNILLCIF